MSVLFDAPSVFGAFLLEVFGTITLSVLEFFRVSGTYFFNSGRGVCTFEIL